MKCTETATHAAHGALHEGTISILNSEASAKLEAKQSGRFSKLTHPGLHLNNKTDHAQPH
jgi:hypothetical protein